MICVMKEKTYSNKVIETLCANRFEALKGQSDDLKIKNEKLIYSILHQPMEQGKIKTARSFGLFYQYPIADKKSQ